jgi:O-antigen/teichoic acid export membrane protein
VIAVATALFGGLNSLLSRSLQSANKAWVDLASNAIWALAVLAGGCLLIPNHKGTGLVIAQGIAALVLGVWQAIVVHRLLFETNTRAAGTPMDLAVLADQ